MSSFIFGFPTGYDVLAKGGEPDRTTTGLDVGPGGGLAVHRTAAASIGQSIKMILATTPGERVMRPEYGSRLQELVFQPNDATTAGLAIQHVKEAVSRWEPRIRVEYVDAGPAPAGFRPADGGDAHDTSAFLRIALHYRIRGDLSLHELEFGLDLQGGGTA